MSNVKDIVQSLIGSSLAVPSFLLNIIFIFISYIIRASWILDSRLYSHILQLSLPALAWLSILLILCQVWNSQRRQVLMKWILRESCQVCRIWRLLVIGWLIAYIEQPAYIRIWSVLEALLACFGAPGRRCCGRCGGARLRWIQEAALAPHTRAQAVKLRQLLL